MSGSEKLVSDDLDECMAMDVSIHPGVCVLSKTQLKKENNKTTKLVC